MTLLYVTKGWRARQTAQAPKGVRAMEPANIDVTVKDAAHRGAVVADGIGARAVILDLDAAKFQRPPFVAARDERERQTEH